MVWMKKTIWAEVGAQQAFEVACQGAEQMQMHPALVVAWAAKVLERPWIVVEEEQLGEVLLVLL